MKFSATFDGVQFPISALSMVQLVANQFGYANLDVDPGPEKTTIKSDGLTVSGKSIDAAAETFVRRALLERK